MVEIDDPASRVSPRFLAFQVRTNDALLIGSVDRKRFFSRDFDS